MLKEYYPSLMICVDCKREFVFTLVEYEKSDRLRVNEIMLCFTCFGGRHGLESFKIKQVAHFLKSTDKHTGLPIAFLWEIPYDEWPVYLKAAFDKPPPSSDL